MEIIFEGSISDLISKTIILWGSGSDLKQYIKVNVFPALRLMLNDK